MLTRKRKAESTLNCDNYKLRKKEEKIITELLKNQEISSIITKSLKKECLEMKKEALLRYVELHGEVPKQNEEYIGRFYKKFKHGQNRHFLEELMRNPIIRSDVERLHKRKIQKENEKKYIENIPSLEKRKLARKTYKELQKMASTHHIHYKRGRKHLNKKELFSILTKVERCKE
jgi:hypothetical protein